MPELDTGSAVPRRILGRELKNLRMQAGYTIHSAAVLVERSDATMWRIETGQTPMRAADVENMCKVYRVSAELTAVLVELARETKAKGWWHSYSDAIPESYQLFVGLEAGSERMHTYESELVPGLLQTEAYTRIITTGVPDIDPAEVERRVQVRMGRQLGLTRVVDPPRYSVVLNEGILYRPIGGRQVMADQLAHLAEIGRRPNVSIKIVPQEIGYHRGVTCAPFVLMEFPQRDSGHLNEPPIVYSENLTGALYLDKPHELVAYKRVLANIHGVALDEDRSRSLLLSVEKELRE